MKTAITKDGITVKPGDIVFHDFNARDLQIVCLGADGYTCDWAWFNNNNTGTEVGYVSDCFGSKENAIKYAIDRINQEKLKLFEKIKLKEEEISRLTQELETCKKAQ